MFCVTSPGRLPRSPEVEVERAREPVAVAVVLDGEVARAAGWAAAGLLERRSGEGDLLADELVVLVRRGLDVLGAVDLAAARRW